MTHTQAVLEIELDNSIIYQIEPHYEVSYNDIDLASIVSNNFITTLPNSIGKAGLIDLPGNLIDTPDLYTASIAFGGYSIRSTIKESLREIFNLTDKDTLSYQASSVIAGFTGGAVKYYLTGQNPYVGMFNNAAYELCNDYTYCTDNEAAFTILFETLDAVVQTSINLATGNYVGIAISTVKLSNAVIEGFSAGLAVNHNIENFYDPFVQEVSERLNELSGAEHNYDYI